MKDEVERLKDFKKDLYAVMSNHNFHITGGSIWDSKNLDWFPGIWIFDNNENETVEYFIENEDLLRKL
jgi:hypothetical protein